MLSTELLMDFHPNESFAQSVSQTRTIVKLITQFLIDNRVKY